MSRRSVYEGLKNAIQYHGLPYHHFEDNYCTIAFESWEQFEGFDKLLNNLPTPKSIKLNIYAEAVAGRTDGVAATVADDVQRLTYWDMYHNMKAIVAAFESMISIILRSGIHLLDFDYESLYVALEHNDYENLPHIDIPIFVGKWRCDDGQVGKEIHLDLSTF